MWWCRRHPRANSRCTSAHSVPAHEERVDATFVHTNAIVGHKSDPRMLLVKDDLMVTHCGGANYSAIALVVVDAKAPHVASQLICILRRR